MGPHDQGCRQFVLFRPTKTLNEKSLSYSLRKLWNKLPSTIHQIDDKKQLTGFLLQKYSHLQADSILI